MASITLGGNAISTVGELPQKGDKAPAFALTGADLKPVTSDDLTGKKVVLNIFPSVDTGVCATSVRTFNEKAAELEDTAVVCVSADLPFAFKRFCGAEGIDNVAVGSTFRNPEFLDDFGVRILDGGMAGLASRAVVVLDTDGTVLHSEQVPEIGQEPDYDAALSAL
ncbi:Thiol peroxidase, Tpx-type [Euzebya pacifica]|jgi:thiol peroxidase|uniref:Thiol peroxidase n=1 Tax=Euzebya pacifica TaxID=1608957 RepID=A0A346XY06_9ACTN|nr:thiol peroxidase [Euzebya pacifica]AXV07103.1 Thiol peroxidase, Tpx-type [Euzebya pacifica]